MRLAPAVGALLLAGCYGQELKRENIPPGVTSGGFEVLEPDTTSASWYGTPDLGPDCKSVLEWDDGVFSLFLEGDCGPVDTTELGTQASGGWIEVPVSESIVYSDGMFQGGVYKKDTQTLVLVLDGWFTIQTEDAVPQWADCGEGLYNALEATLEGFGQEVSGEFYRTL